MRKRQRALACGLAGAGLLAAVAAGTLYGAAPIPWPHLVGILAHTAGLPVTPDWPAWQATVLLHVRLPRVLVGLCVGGGLALCGGALQALFRNPLADPGVLGVSSGAALGRLSPSISAWPPTPSGRCPSSPAARPPSPPSSSTASRRGADRRRSAPCCWRVLRWAA